MANVGERLRELRKRGGISVRDMAKLLLMDNHSTYAYYESPRFKELLPIELARQIARALSLSGVDPSEVLELAGLDRPDAESEARKVTADRDVTRTVRMTVSFPSEASLTRMFHGMLEAAGKAHLSDELSQTLAQLLPSALEATPVDQLGEYLDYLNDAKHAARPLARAKASLDSPR